MRGRRTPTIGASTVERTRSDAPGTSPGPVPAPSFHEATTCDRAPFHRTGTMENLARSTRRRGARLGRERRADLAAPRENRVRGAPRDGHRDAPGDVATAHGDDDRVRADAAAVGDGVREELLPRARHGGRPRRRARARRAVRAAARAVHGRHHAVDRHLYRARGAQPPLPLVRLRARRLHGRADRPAVRDDPADAVPVRAHARRGSRARHRVLGCGQRADPAAQLREGADALAGHAPRDVRGVHGRRTRRRRRPWRFRAALRRFRRRHRRLRGQPRVRVVRGSAHSRAQPPPRAAEQ